MEKGIVTKARDITEHKRPEKALRESEERFRNVLESSLDMIYRLNLETGTYDYVSPSSRQVIGYSPEELTALGVERARALAHPDDIQRLDENVIQLVTQAPEQGIPQGIEYRFNHKELGYRWVSDTRSLIYDERNVPVAVVGNLRDITKRKRTEEELEKYQEHLQELVEERTAGLSKANEQLKREITERRQAEKALRAKEEYFHALIENSQDAIVVLDRELKLRDASMSIERLMGYKLQELLRMSLFEFIHPDDLPNAAEAFAELVQNPGNIVRRELCYQHKDGSWHHVEAIGQNLLDDPVVSGIVVNFHDTTERKRAQEKLERLYESEMKLRQQLEEEMKKRAEFTRALAHELKTPLTPVVMSSQTLVSQLQEEPLLMLEPLLRLATNISRGASNLNSRIDELLDLARGEMGMLKLRTEPVEVLALLREVMDDVATVASNQGQSLVSRLPHSLPLISADRTRLRQIVLNLLNNAFKFTPHGGRITLRAKEDDGKLTIEIKDTGLGMSKEEQEQLFEPYHRVEHDRERLSGLGLGLALCKTLVELHGGRIWVQSGVGKGSTFSFSLPLQSSAGEQETLTLGEE